MTDQPVTTGNAEHRLMRTQGDRPLGFRAAGLAAGIKASSNLDLALVFNEGSRVRGGRRVHPQ